MARKDRQLEELRKKRHPAAGNAVKVEEGPFKGQYFKVIDYLVNQYQGKDMDGIAEMEPRLVTPVVGRGYPLDEKIVFGQLYPSMQFICVHDDELKIKEVKPPLKVVEGEKEDDAGTTSEGDNSTTESRESESDGRPVSSPKLEVKDGGKSKRAGKKD